MPDPLANPRQNRLRLVAFAVVQHEIIPPRASVGADLAFEGLFSRVRPPVFDHLLHLEEERKKRMRGVRGGGRRKGGRRRR